MEIWKSVVGFEGVYEISDLGKLKNVKTGYETYGHRNQLGYMVSGLTKNKKSKSHFIHRLVATAFLANPENKPCVNHKNGKRDDNRLINLEWATVGENAIHGSELKKSGNRPTYQHEPIDYKIPDELTIDERRAKARRELTEMRNEWVEKQNRKLYGSKK